jgi:hypothetical protein
MNGDTWLETGFPIQTWTIKEVALMLKINQETLRLQIVNRGLGVKIGNRWRLTKQHIEELCSESATKSGGLTFDMPEKEYDELLAQATKH